MILKQLAALLLAGLLLVSCGSTGNSSSSAPEGGASSDQSQSASSSGGSSSGSGSVSAQPPEDLPDPLDTYLQSMTLQQKVGQLFIIRPETLNTQGAGATSVNDAMRTMLAQYPVGGIILFDSNIVSPEQTAAFTQQLQEASALPLFMSVDEEGGQVARLANRQVFGLPRYDSPSAVTESSGVDGGLEMGRTIGAYLKQYGFNMDFAPVADVNTNPDNPVIGTRSFSPDPVAAATMAGAMASGLRENGIIPVFKHFPGHGDTSEDSHTGLAVTNKTREEMQACEWIPFQRATWGDCIMTAHIAAPEITGDMTPSTLSRVMVTDVLRGELGFTGLVITDAMEMKAVTDTYGTGEAAVMAIQAGCDMILIPPNLEEAYNAVLTAVQDGSIDPVQLDTSVRRILEYKRALYGNEIFGQA